MDPLRLTPITQAGWHHKGETLLNDETRVVSLGRVTELGIPAHETTISRRHCEVRLNSNHCVEVLPFRPVWIVHGGTEEEEISPKGVMTKVRQPLAVQPE